MIWLPATEGEPDFPIYTGSLGNPGEALAVQGGWKHDVRSGNFDGAGGAMDRETAAHIAVAESLERYLPTSFFADLMVSQMPGGRPYHSVWSSMLVVTASALFFLVLAIRTFRWDQGECA